MLENATIGSEDASSFAQRCESSGEIAVAQTSSSIGRPGMPFWMSAPRPPSSSLM
jgi:hypothetical protein